ncbi:MAG: hypothetical protein ACRDSL_26165 [Pseudonocardiaceae bacterium]
MPYEAVSAYTVLIGETGSATTVTVHGSADEAWQALADAVHSRSTRWMPRNADAAALADRWRAGDPQRRFWQVSTHQLQVIVPATGETPSRPAAQPAATQSRSPLHWRRRRRSQPHSAG